MLDAFERRYGPTNEIQVYRAPGRVNLIGEHTDYNLGFVCPVALELATFVATAPSQDGKLRIYSEDRKEMREFEPSVLSGAQRAGHWTDYPIGVARELIRAGFPVEPANLLIRSTVPEGSGLSSSAALEVSSALAFLRGRTMDPLDLAKLCQRAERDFVGMPCGIMDQYISIFGREHAAVAIDCRNLERREVPLPEGILFLAVNSMVKHELSGSAYRDRVRECATAVEQIRRLFPQVSSLRDVSSAQFAGLEAGLPDVIRRRARHVVSENERVNRFVDAIRTGDLQAMGQLLIESHRSLQYDYEVSCEALDFLVDAALQVEGVFGSRMTGGGFGGCTVTMLRPEAAQKFQSEICSAYQKRFGMTPRIYRCIPSAGANELKNFEMIPAFA